MERPHVYILAGGRSLRFGADKARARIDERALILHVVDVLSPRAAALCVVAERADKYADLGLRTIADSGERLGPLDGLRAALRDLPAGQSWLLLAACDMIGLRAAWIDALCAAAQDKPTRAVAFRGEKWQPLFSLYHRDLLPAVDQQIASGRLAIWELLQSSQATALPLPPGWGEAIDVDTVGELATARTRATRRGPGT